MRRIRGLYTLNGKVKINPEYYELESEEYEVYNTNFFNRKLKPTLVGMYKKNLISSDKLIKGKQND